MWLARAPTQVPHLCASTCPDRKSGAPSPSCQRLTLRLSTDPEDPKERAHCRDLQRGLFPFPKLRLRLGDHRSLAPKPQEKEKGAAN